MKRILTFFLMLCSCMAMAQTGIPNARPTNSQFFTNSADTSQVWLYPGTPYKAKRLLTYGSIVGSVASVFGRSGAVTALQADYSAYYKPLNYVPDWSEIANKPSFFSGSYTDLANKPTLFSGSYTDLSNKPVIFSGTTSQFTKGDGTFATIQAADVPTLNQNTTGSAAKLNNQDASYYLDYTHLSNSPDNISFFRNGILANYDGVGLSGINTGAGSRQYIVTNMQGGGFNETDYISFPGIASSARGGHAFYTYNKQGGTSGNLLFDFGTFGDSHAFYTGDVIVPGTINHNVAPSYVLVIGGLSGNEIQKVSLPELANDLATGATHTGLPSITAGSGAGTGASINVYSASTDNNFIVTLTTGSAPVAGGTILNVTFASAFPAAPVIVFSPASPAAAALSGSTAPYYSNSTTTDFEFKTYTGTLPAGTYVWSFHVQ